MPSLKLTVSHLKIDGWITGFLSGWFSGTMLLGPGEPDFISYLYKGTKFSITTNLILHGYMGYHPWAKGSHESSGVSWLKQDFVGMISLTYLFHQQGSSWNTVPKTKSKRPKRKGERLPTTQGPMAQQLVCTCHSPTDVTQNLTCPPGRPTLQMSRPWRKGTIQALSVYG